MQTGCSRYVLQKILAVVALIELYEWNKYSYILGRNYIETTTKSIGSMSTSGLHRRVPLFVHKLDNNTG